MKGEEGLHSFGFAGGLWDAETGLVRFGVRGIMMHILEIDG